MAYLIDLAKATLYIRDAGSNYIEVKIGEGNLSYTEARNLEMVLSRGDLDTVRENNDEAMEVSFSFIWEYVSSTTYITIEDALKQRNGAAGWVSANPDTNAPYAVNLELVHMPGATSTCGDGSTGGNIEHVFLLQFNYENLGHSLKDATVDCSGKCNAKQATTSRTSS